MDALRAAVAVRDWTVRILIVTDDPTLARRWDRALRSHGVTVDVTANGDVAVESLDHAAYDLILLDLPDPVALRICRTVRAAASTIPVLLFGVRERAGERMNGHEVGDEYLMKPLTFLQRHNGSRADAVVVDDLTLDPVTRQVYRGRRHVDLTSKEFALLEYLMRHAGQPLSRAKIAEHVWGVHWNRGTNVIDVFISHLRQKLHSPGERPVIYSVRGVGYLVATAGHRAVATLMNRNR